MRTRIAALVVAGALLAFAGIAPTVRRGFMHDVITWDAPPRMPARLPGAMGSGLGPATRVRVVLIDGLSASTAARMPTWTALCKRGVSMTVDVGFPTVSLPVEVSLWTGLTQQQTGVMFRSDRPLVPPLDRRGIPARVLGSIAIAEHHGWIARSLGFAHTEPEQGARPELDRDPEVWKQVWQAHALAAVSSDTRLAFVHVLRVDSWGHRKGQASAEYANAASESDAILAQLVAAAPDARWFLLSDHGHLPGGGHGGEDRDVRQVQQCIVGPDIASDTGKLVHLVDVSRALADSLGVTLDKHALGRSLSAALRAPLEEDQAVPPLALGSGALAVLAFVIGLVAIGWSVRSWWLAPWWFVVACTLLLLWRGVPTMSMPMVYAQERITDLFDFDKRLMMRSWLASLPIAFVATWFGLARTTLLRVLAGQLALPIAALVGVLTACGAWGALFGAHVSPTVPHYTAFASALFLIVSQGSAAVALAVLARSAQQAFDRRRASGTSRTET
jgi:hypothetical protein